MNITEQIVERLKALRDQMRLYGLIMGGAMIVIELLKIWQYNNLSSFGILILIIAKVAILFGVSNYIIQRIKPEFFKTGITYSQSFSLIFRLFLYGSLLVGLFSFILTKWINPDILNIILENTIAFVKASIESAQIPSEQMVYIEEIIDELEKAEAPGPLTNMWNQMWSYLMWGVFVGLILSTHIKDKRKTEITTDTNNNL